LFPGKAKSFDKFNTVHVQGLYDHLQLVIITARIAFFFVIYVADTAASTASLILQRLNS
jgi:hypothetical protein